MAVCAVHCSPATMFVDIGVSQCMQMVSMLDSFSSSPASAGLGGSRKSSRAVELGNYQLGRGTVRAVNDC